MESKDTRKSIRLNLELKQIKMLEALMVKYRANSFNHTIRLAIEDGYKYQMRKDKENEIEP